MYIRLPLYPSISIMFIDKYRFSSLQNEQKNVHRKNKLYDIRPIPKEVK